MLLTRDDIQRAIKMRKDGIKTPIIVAQLHVSKSSFYNYLHKYGMFDQWNDSLPVILSAYNSHGKNHIPLGPLVTMYQRGHTHREMADFFKCSTWKIHSYIKKYGLQPEIKDHVQDMFTVSKHDRMIQ